MVHRATATSRRGFAKAVAAAAAAATVPAVFPALADSPAPAPTLSPPPSPTPTPTPAGPSSAAEALTEVVRVRWGKNLTGEQLGDIAKAIDGRLRGAEAMKKIPLANADEPDFVFTAAPEGRAS